MCSIQRYYDYVVVGAGVMGISTALYLVQKFPTAKCALIEQFELGHNQGSSHSEIRIIRSTYHHPFYRDLCLQALAKNWPFVQKLLGDQFIVQNPFLAFVQEQHPQYKNYKEVAVTSQNIKEMSVQQMRKMYPYAPNVTSTKTVFVQQTSGVVLAQQYQRKALQYIQKCPTLDIYQKTEVLQILNDETGVYLTIRNRNHKDVYVLRAKKATLSCGRWIGKLIPELGNIVKPVKQTVSYWKLKNEKECALGKYPCWVYIHKNEYHYSLPDATGHGIKFALHNQDPEHEKKFSSQKELEQADLKQSKKYIEQLYKDQVVGLTRVQSCYYSVTKTQDFVIDWSDEHENVLICSPCSGHGFKFGPIIGQIVADLLKKDESISIYEKYRYLTRIFYHLGVNLQ